MNRALIVASFFSESSELNSFDSSSLADDIRLMHIAVKALRAGEKRFEAGAAGTVLRFLAVRLSREVGEFYIEGTERLFSRPQKELVQVLELLGCQVELGTNFIRIRSRGVWPSHLVLTAKESSQVLSALLLSAWNLPQELTLELKGELTSGAYAKMTIDWVSKGGLNVVPIPSGWKVHSHSRPSPFSLLEVEGDWSSAFALMGVAAARGEGSEVEIEGLHSFQGKRGIQPDSFALEVWKQLGGEWSWSSSGVLKLRAPAVPKAVRLDLQDTPDLFPVLAAICAFAEGQSVLRGAPQLKSKESDRIVRTHELLSCMGVHSVMHEDGLTVVGVGKRRPPATEVIPHFFADEDHRLVMAAEVALQAGFLFEVAGADAVSKSFPNFFNWTRVRRIALVGHRGTGKTSLLRRLEQVEVTDLDAEIERELGVSVFEFLDGTPNAEQQFRVAERNAFQAWCAKARRVTQHSRFSVLAVGAGFEGLIPKDVEVVWVRRPTDSDGRVFTDRPRLNPEKDALEEYLERFRVREQRYQAWAHAVLDLPEGIEATLPENPWRRFEWAWWSNYLGIDGPTPEGKPGICWMTLMPGPFACDQAVRWLRMGVSLIELREDLWREHPEQWREVLSVIPESRRLISLRGKTRLLRPSSPLETVDWALENSEGGIPPETALVSVHDRIDERESLSVMLDRLEQSAKKLGRKLKLKASPVIETWSDLAIGEQWRSRDPDRNYFFPRSLSQPGRWTWYRQWISKFQPTFIREGAGSAADQPTWLEWAVSSPSSGSPQGFAAVLGRPVRQSRTPTFHAQWASELGMPVFSINVNFDEWGDAFPFLDRLGLRFAAITSPLKSLAAQVGMPSETVVNLGAANTLVKRNAFIWESENTDILGVEAWKPLLPPKGEGVAVWGGGGVLSSLSEVFPEAWLVSAREARLRSEKQDASSLRPRWVIWAAPHLAGLSLPPKAWKPDWVLDANYAENSAGREYASQVGARYVSGLGWFEAQARGQEQFFKREQR